MGTCFDGMIRRRDAKVVSVGGVKLGGANPIVVQSMTNTDTRDAAATVAQVKALAAAGCGIVRCACPDAEAAEALKTIVKESPVPIVADIHFDYRLALASIDAGVAKVRINPGNIGGDDRLAEVIRAAKARQIPIRIGVNSGSVSREILAKHGGRANAEALAESALEMVRKVENLGFDDIVISIKSSSAKTNYDAHMILADQIPYPFHLGITEAGTPTSGKTISAIGIGSLLMQGIGDTIRVSLTGDPLNEVPAAYDILRALDLLPSAIRLVCCPTCGRTRIDLPAVAAEVEKGLPALENERRLAGKPGLRVALMGCAVNGPGEARDADVGCACGVNEGLLFRRGEILRKVPADEIAPALFELIRNE